MSIAIHALLLGAAGLLLIHVVQEDHAVDFLSAPRGENHQTKIKNTETKPARVEHDHARAARQALTRIVVPGSSHPPLPEAPPTVELTVPENSFAAISTAGMKTDSPMDFTAGSANFSGTTAHELAPFRMMTRDRCNLTERLQKLRENDGDERCERAVSNGLEWLRVKQNADGSWGRQHKGAKKEGVTNFVPVLGEVYDPKLPANTFDLILLVDVYHEFSHPVQMLAAMRKALKPGGMLVFLEFRAEDDEVPIKPEHKMTKVQLTKELAANGYKLVKEFDGLPWQHMMWFGKDEK